MTLLILAEHDNTGLKPSTLNTIGAALAIGGEIHVLVAGHNAHAVATQASQIPAVTKVLHANSPALAHGLAENIAPLLAELGKHYTHLLTPSGTYGKNILPRAAALLDVQQISDISKVIDARTFERPVYAGNAIATVQSSDPVICLTVRGTNFDPAPATGGNAPIETIADKGESGLSRYLSTEAALSERPELTAAKIVVSGGRGVGSKENFSIIEALADKLGAAVGASRAAVDAGFVPNDCQVGQTGKVVAPDLYIAVGISGAIQHLAGMKDSKVIVAINKDPDAPIFQVADYGLVADLFQAVPEWTGKA